MKYLIILISLGLLGTATVLTTQMIGLAKENQELKIDLAEINHVRYGLLNADEWRDQVALILGKKILEMDPGAKTVICSTDKQKARQKEAKEIGVLGFLIKPINREKLKETLKEILID